MQAIDQIATLADSLCKARTLGAERGGVLGETLRLFPDDSKRALFPVWCGGLNIEQPVDLATKCCQSIGMDLKHILAACIRQQGGRDRAEMARLRAHGAAPAFGQSISGGRKDRRLRMAVAMRTKRAGQLLGLVRIDMGMAVRMAMAVRLPSAGRILLTCSIRRDRESHQPGCKHVSASSQTQTRNHFA